MAACLGACGIASDVPARRPGLALRAAVSNTLSTPLNLFRRLPLQRRRHSFEVQALGGWGQGADDTQRRRPLGPFAAAATSGGGSDGESSEEAQEESGGARRGAGSEGVDVDGEELEFEGPALEADDNDSDSESSSSGSGSSSDSSSSSDESDSSCEEGEEQEDECKQGAQGGKVKGTRGARTEGETPVVALQSVDDDGAAGLGDLLL